ncbi:MAG: hypothetical protein F4Y67_07545 [Chloroflexi bacterium]|nr:hypothetical protein [Chloroflexota bacterium]
MFLARKFSNAKWFSNSGAPFHPISADAVTSDLRTQDNKLSFWECATENEQSLREVVLAITSNYRQLDKCYVVWIEIEKANALGIELVQSPGNTPVRDLVNRHMDMCQLDYFRLGDVAGLISESLSKSRFTPFEKKDVCEILADAVTADRVVVDALEDKLQNAVQKCLDQRVDGRK